MRIATITLMALVLAACGGPPERKVQVVDDTGTQLAMTLRPDSADAYNKGHEAYLAVSRRWLDAYTLAGSTPRISLPPVIANMQAIRREMEGLALPQCLAQAKRFRVAAMDRQLSEFTAFLAMTETQPGNLDRANQLVESATTVANACNPKI